MCAAARHNFTRPVPPPLRLSPQLAAPPAAPLSGRLTRLRVPSQAPPEGPASADVEALDGETNALWAQLQHALATKRELQRKIASAENAAKLWEKHRESVQQLASSHQSSGAGVTEALEGAQQLSSTMQQGWHLLRTAEAASGPAAPGEQPPADAATAPTGPRGLQQRFQQRRGEFETVRPPHAPHAAPCSLLIPLAPLSPLVRWACPIWRLCPTCSARHEVTARELCVLTLSVLGRASRDVEAVLEEATRQAATCMVTRSGTR